MHAARGVVLPEPMKDRKEPSSGPPDVHADTESSKSASTEEGPSDEIRIRRSPGRELRHPPPNASLEDLVRLTARCAQSAPDSLPSLLALMATCRETSETLRSQRPRAVDISRIAEMGDIGRSLVDFWMWRDLLRRARAGAKSGLFPGGMGEESSRG